LLGRFALSELAEQVARGLLPLDPELAPTELRFERERVSWRPASLSLVAEHDDVGRLDRLALRERVQLRLDLVFFLQRRILVRLELRLGFIARFELRLRPEASWPVSSQGAMFSGCPTRLPAWLLTQISRSCRRTCARKYSRETSSSHRLHCPSIPARSGRWRASWAARLMTTMAMGVPEVGGSSWRWMSSSVHTISFDRIWSVGDVLGCPPADQRPILVGPDWVCEVLSPSTAAHDKITKRALYARSGIRNYWIIDVDAHTLEAFELLDQRWVLAGTYGDDAVARIAPFEPIELAVGRLFLPRAE
jgi:hypothetical protein